jgi:hypothetical protein
MAFGKKKTDAPVDDIELLEVEIRRHEAAAAASAQRVDEIEFERRDALLADNLEGALALKVLADREEMIIERCALLLPDLRRRFAAAREEARERNFQQLLGEYTPEAQEYVETAEHLLALAHKIAGIVSRAGSIGCEHRALSEMPTAPALAGPDAAIVVSSEILARWKIALAGQTGAASTYREPRVKNSPTAGVYTEFGATIARPPAPRRVLDADGRINPPAASRQPLRPDRSCGDGEREVIVLRSGIEIGGRRLVAGDRLIVDETTAAAQARAGAVDIVPSPPPLADQSISRDAAQ